MNNFKRFLSLALAVLMTLSYAPTIAYGIELEQANNALVEYIEPVEEEIIDTESEETEEGGEELELEQVQTEEEPALELEQAQEELVPETNDVAEIQETGEAVAKVGDTGYATIDEAIAAWTNNTTLTLLADVTLSDVIKLKSTEHHTLDLGTYTMTAASGKNAIEITCEGRSSASYAITVNADAENPGGITATGKACIYYSKSGSTKDRPIFRIYNGVFNGSYSINSKSNGNTNCPQVWIYGGTFNGNVNLTKNMLRVFGGTFNGWINCTGDSSAYREISGGRFKSWQFMTADADSKFWVGTSKADYNVGCYVDDEGYLVVGGDIVTEAGDKFEASSANYSGWSSYLKYSSAATNSLYYTSVEEALADNNKTNGSVTVYVEELDMTGINYKGTIVVPENSKLTITNAPADLKVTNEKGELITPNANGTYITIEPTGTITPAYTYTNRIWGEGTANSYESFVVELYKGETKIASASLNNYENIIDGDVYVTWGLPLDGSDSNYWDVEWTEGCPKVTMAPDKVVLVSDGKKVAENNVQLNGPDNLNKIYAATADENGKITGYYTSFEAAVAAGDNVAILRAGSYNVPTGKNLTITGAVDGVVFDNIGAHGMGGANVTFNNVTFNYATNSTYKGLQHAGNLVYNNCVINGQVFLYGESETFNNCTFNTTDKDNYNVWTYGAKEVEFNGCTFNCAGKSVLIYKEGDAADFVANVEVNGCGFVASSAVEGKAAIEMDSSFIAGINLTIDGKTTVTGFGIGNVSSNSLWNNKKGSTGANNDITVVVNGETVLAPKFAAQIGEVKYETLAEALAAAKDGNTVEILASEITFDADAASIVIDKAITIKGAGKEKTKLVFNSATSAFVIQSSNVKFQDMTIKQGEKDNSFHISISKDTWNAPKVQYSNITIKNIDFVGGDYALCLIGENVVVEECSFTDQNSHNIIIYSLKGDSKITNNTFNASKGDNKSAVLYEGGADNATDLSGFIGGGKLTLSGNTANGKGVFFQFTNWKLVEGMELAITGNKIDAFTNKAIALYGMDGVVTAAGDEFDSVSVTGNVFTNVPSGKTILKEYTGTVEVSVDRNYLGSAAPDYKALLVGDKVVVKGYYKDEALIDYVGLAVAKINDENYYSLQSAINAVQDGETIELLADVTENVTLTEKTGLYYTIDGNGKTMNGTITVTALSDTNDNRRITIKNIKFVDTADANVDFISSVNTNHYPRLTVENCSFTGSGNDGDVAIRLKSSHSVVIKDCTGTGLHSFLQNTSGWNLTIENVTVTDSKGGLALGTVQGVTVKDCDLTVDGYGIRLDADTYNNNAVIESCKVNAFIPVVVRKANANSNVTFNGTNTMTATNTDGYWCVIGTTEYEENGKLPVVDDDTTVTVTVNDAGLDKNGIYNDVLGAGTWGGIDWTLTKDGTLTIAPTKGTPVADPNSGKTYEVGAWREAVCYDSTGEGKAIEGWPYDRTKVKTLIIEEGVTSIGSFTAQGFTNLTGEVVIPSTVTYIGQEAFQNAPITKLTFAAGGDKELCIAPGAFKNLQITEVALPDDRQVHIHAWVFMNNTKLENVTLPATVTIVPGSNHVEYWKNGTAHTGSSYDVSIFADVPNLKTITFGSETVRDQFVNGYNLRTNIEAYINLTAYSTLEAAINAAQNGETVKLIKNVTLTDTVTVPAGKTVTLDLNGKTVSMETADDNVTSLILNNGNLTVTDSAGNGKLSYKYTGTNSVDAYNTIESAPGSVLTVKGGTIENLSENCLIAYAVDGLTNGGTGDVTLNIEGGKLTSKKIAVRIFANSTTNTGYLNISGGEIDGRVIIQNASAKANKAALNITGGTFTANEYKADVLYVGGSNGASGDITASVSAGTFNGEIISTIDEGFISDGTFSKPVSEEYCAEGYIPTENADGTYGVKVGSYVAKVGEAKFESLEEAFKAATSGDTIELLADVTIDYKWDARYTGAKFTVPVTINGNGHTIKFTGEINDAGNYSAAFRFEANATVNNLTIDMSEATPAKLRAISSKGNLTVDGCTFIGKGSGNNNRAIIFGEGAGANVGNLVISVTNSKFSNWKRGISDNENGQDVKSVTITGNEFADAGVNVSASETVTFTGNTVNGGDVIIVSYANNNKLNVTATDNTLAENGKYGISANTINAQNEFALVYCVSTKAELNAALAAAKEGDEIRLTADIDYGTDQLKIEKAITLDLGGYVLTTRNAYGGISVKNNPTIKNGTIVHASNTAAIKVWNATAFEDLVIDVQGKGDANKTIGGIVLQSGSTTKVGSIKNVTIKGDALTNGIETYNCGDATENVIGSMENVTIDAVGTAMNISAPCGTATGCTFKGGVNGIEIWIKGNYSASLNLVECDVTGGVYAHDEFNSNPDIVNNGTLSLTADSETTGASVDDITLTIARAEKVEGVLAGVMENAQAKVNDTYYLTIDDALAAAKAGDTVTIFAGDYTQNLNVNKAITVVGETDAEGTNLVKFTGKLSVTANGATVKGLDFNNGSETAGYISAKDVLIEDCSVVGGNGFRYCYTSGTVTFKDSTITGATYGIHFDGSEGGNIVIDNCVITGWTSFAGTIGKVTISDTEFAEGNYNQLRFYQNAELTNVKFNPDMTIDWGKKAEATFNGCSVSDDSALTDVIYLGDIVDMGVEVTIDGNPVTVEAKIGDTYYLTFEEAYEAAEVGNEIVLYAPIVVEEDKTLDLKGVTISRTHGSEYAMIHVLNGATLTINDTVGDGKITYAAGGNNTGAAIWVEGALVQEGGTIEVTGTWSFGFAVDLRPNAWGTAHTKPATFVMNGGSINSTDTAVRVASNSIDSHEELGVSFTMNGGTIESTWDAIFVQHLDYVGDLDITINDGKVSGENSVMRIYGDAGSDIDMIVKGGEFTGAIKVADAYADTDAISISGGTYTEKPAKAYIADGYEIEYDNENEVFNVVAKAVASVNGEEYSNLKDAVEAAKNGKTIYLISDVTLKETLEIPAGYNVILDLNGKTVSYSSADAGDAMLTNNGTLIITDGTEAKEGKFVYTYTGEADVSYSKGNYTIFNNGALEIAGGTVENATAKMSHASYAINTGAGASLVVSGGKVLNLNGHAIRQVSFGTGANNVHIEGGYIEGTRAIQVQLPGSDPADAPEMKLTISGGELKSNESTYNLAVYVYSNGQSAENVKLDLKGGIFNGNIAFNGTVTDSMEAGAVSVTGGTFNGAYGVFSYADDTNNTISITGGTFATKYSEMYAKDDGYVFEQNNDTYGVRPANYVAEVGGVKYESLQEAINACVAGNNTVTLLADSSEDVIIKQVEGVNVTIEGNGKEYSGTITIHGNARYNGTETLTIQNVAFVTEEAGHYFIDSNSTGSVERYAHNVTVTGCTFTATGEGIGSAVAMRIRQGFNISVTNSTTTALHSLFQGYGCTGVTISEVNVNGKNGISVGTSTNVVIKKTNINATGYGVRADGTGAYDAEVENCTISAELPVVVRKATGAYNLTVKDCTLTADNEGKYQVIFTNGDDGTYELPTGAYSATIGEDIRVFPTYVAQIGEVTYPTLAAAIAAAQAGDTITFIADITENVTVNKNVTIDGADKNYTGTMTVSTGKTVTVQNVNFVKGCIDKAKSTSGTLTVKDCDFDGVDGSINYAVTMRGGKTVTLEGVTVKNYGYGMLYVPSATTNVNVKNTTVTGGNYGFHWVYGTTATLENVTITDAKYGLYVQNYAGKTINVKNSTISSIAIWERSNSSGVQTFNFEGANTVGALTDSQYAKYVLAEVNATLAAPEGANVTTSVENNTVLYDGSKYYVGIAVAAIGDVQYASLQAAVNAAQDGDIITVLADHELVWDGKTKIDGSMASMVVVAGKAVTIDLNDKKITVDADKMNGTDLYAVFAADEGGSLTLKDSVGTGSVTATGVAFKASNSTAYCMMMAYENGTKLTVESGTYYLGAAHDSLIYAGGGDKIVVINGGNFTLGNVGVGTNGKPWIFNAYGSNDRSVVVNGGTFNADVNHQFWANEVYVPETKALKDKGDGTWTVVDAVAYAEEIATSTGSTVRKVGYATLQEAINANSKSVTLIADIALDTSVVVAKEMTLDLNGHTITGTDNNTSGNFYLINVNKGNLTIDDSVGGGKITLTATTERNWTASSVVVANNLGTLTVEGGTIEHLGGTSMAYGIDNLTNGADTVATTTIEGGKVDSTYFAIRQFANNGTNKLYINGGEIGYVWMQSPNANANNALTHVEGGEVAGICVSGANAIYDLKAKIDCIGDGDVYGTMPAGKVLVEEAGYYTLADAVAQVVDAEGNVVGSYATVSEALNEAQNGYTVKLLADATETYVMVVPGVTLDLNGYTLEASYVVGFNGSNVVDNSESNEGLLKAAANNVALAETNAQLPVYTGEGYMFAKVLGYNQVHYDYMDSEGYIQYVFQPLIEESAHEYILKGSASSHTKIVVVVNWIDEKGTAVAQSFECNDDFVKTFINSYDKTTGKYGKAFYIKLTGAEIISAYTIQSGAESDAKVVKLSNHYDPANK